jgi:hypothetical protein
MIGVKKLGNLHLEVGVDMHFRKNVNRGYIVDKEDEYLLHKYLFYTKSDGYVVTNIASNGKRTQISLHRLVLPGHDIVDHVSRNKLDNRRDNLRPATLEESAHNKGKYSCNKSKYKGVTQSPRNGGKWEANIRVNGKKIYLGLFITQEQAANCYNVAAVCYHGNFAVLNQIE